MSLTVPEAMPVETAAAEPPLVVDLDGTLIRSDTLIESFFASLGIWPLGALRAMLALREGKAALKARLADIALPDPASLPLNKEIVDFIETERSRGRRVYLASAADRRIAESVATELGVFDGVFATHGDVNLKGETKAAVLVEAFGAKGFDYIGNGSVDFPVWEQARSVLVADAPVAVEREAMARWPNARVIVERTISPPAYLKAMRLHQWAKNLLLFVPAMTGHRWGLGDIAACLLAFVSFGLTASSVYVTNDLVDLARDREHTTKRHRPFAAGDIPPIHGVFMIPALLIAGLLTAALVGPFFLLVLLAYCVTTLAYSLLLKRKMLLDVVTLAGLYGIRLYAGAIAVGISLSAWLGTFALFVFTCLALVKRCAELVERSTAGRGNPSGRDYQIADLPVLFAMAAASGFTAVLVVALYADSAAVRALYTSPNRLYLICVVLLYWVGRVLMLTHRNRMHDDPVLFAATDRVSQACALVCLGIVLVSV
ncbi:UbiA family prenyltransferase [Roseomonas sp. SSH11]|uniref:UbiA family prenyltransferase n=1 Tax=Pararoseomonas baculiformis TaxID=2820812 RepID=A0ABS4AAL0_9PROT|nr:UbiA family prenyltransferase [Pararoseomonas baculiformis]MBP0443891.1 UbiA family prenyltransferase [Pararoseomonas baculiformis]